MEVPGLAFCLLLVVTILPSPAASAPIAETDPNGIAIALATPGLLVTKVFLLKGAVLKYDVWNFPNFPRK